MKIFLFILIFLGGFISKAQLIYNSECIAHDTVTRFYLEDAKKLNMRHIYRANLTDKDSGRLNQTITNEYLRALIAVYNATTMPARDSVVNIFKIHAYNPGLHNLLLMVDSNMQWVKNFKNNIFPTGQASFDSVMAKHYLHKTYYSAIFSNTATLVMNSDTSFNAPALGKFLKLHLPEISLWDYDFFFGEGNDIEDTVNSTFHWFRFMHGWGDCSNGCIYHKYWQFRVYNDCTVEYGGSYGDPMYVGIKENELTFENMKAYPNPTNDKLTLEGLPASSQVLLSNVLGQRLYSLSSAPVTTVLDLSNYASGIYYLTIKTENGARTQKIIKE